MAKRIRPVLLPYQRRWLYDRSAIKLCEKSRRIGITFATAAEAVSVAGKRQAEGGMDVWYMVSNEDDAREFIHDCALWATAFGAACEAVGERLIDDEDENGQTRGILAFEIRFASGNKIRALSSNPRRLRGKQGYAIIDEAAYHDDLEGFMTAANAFLMLGGRIAIISTHRGVDNPFNKMILKERKRRAEGHAPHVSLHRYTLDDALADGFYFHTVILKNPNLEPTKAGEQDWREWLCETVYALRADQELHAIPDADGAKILWTPGVIEDTRWSGKIPAMFRRVVSVDPSGSDEGGGDDCGIIAAGITGDDHIYVTHDETTPAGPGEWAADSVGLYHRIEADLLVAEKNYGGKMVRDLIALVDGGDGVEYKDVVSKSSKYNRAVPIAAHNRKGKIHFCGHFPELEAELTTWREGMPSPNRLDAFVQACSELLWPDEDVSVREGLFFL